MYDMIETLFGLGNLPQDLAALGIMVGSFLLIRKAYRRGKRTTD